MSARRPGCAGVGPVTSTDPGVHDIVIIVGERISIMGRLRAEGPGGKDPLAACRQGRLDLDPAGPAVSSRA